MDGFCKKQLHRSLATVESKVCLEKSIQKSAEIKIKHIPDDSHNIIEVHEIKDKSSSSIILEVLPRPNDCENIIIFGDENDAKVVSANVSRICEVTNSGKADDCKSSRENSSFQCFHCGFDCQIFSHMEEHYNILRLSKPFENCEIGFECKLSHCRKNVDSNRKVFLCPVCEFSCSEDVVTLKEHISECHTKEAPFLCSECKATFKTKRSLASHLLVHASDKPYKCLYCSFACKLRKYLKSHVKMVHSRDKPFTCSKCPFRGKRKFDIAKHEVKHNSEKPFHCKVCDFKSKSRYYLKKHMLIHKGTLPFHCSLCDYRCVTKYILKDHYINHHTHEKPFSCSICGLCFKRNTTLKRHMVTHSEAKPFKCHLCDYSCSRKDNLKSHLTVAHTNFKPFKCTECDFTCKLKTALKLHVRVHSPERPYVCEQCNYRFKSENKLRRHAVSHSFEKRYPCPHCPFRCKTKTDLKIHIHFSHSVKDPLCCLYCDFVCKKAVTLEKHMKDHGVEKSLSCYCNLCNAKFSQKIQVKNHTLSHTSDISLHSPFPIRSDIKNCCDNHFGSHRNHLDISEETFKYKHVNIHINSEILSGNLPQVKIESEDVTESSLKNESSQIEIVKLNYDNKETFINPELAGDGGDYPQIKVESEDPTESSSKIEFSQMEIVKLTDDSNETIPFKQNAQGHNSICEEPTLCIISDGPAYFDEIPLHMKSSEYQCENCTFRCSKKAEFKQHTKKHNATVGNRCPRCEEIFSTKTELKDHLSTTHSDYKPFRCQYCCQGFKLKSNLKQHGVVHSEDKPYHCPLCDYRAKLRETLRRHYVTHSTEKPYQCSVCTYRCKLKEKLKRHFIIHSDDRPFHCPRCDYTCKTKELLKKHSIVHTREKSSGPN